MTRNTLQLLLNLLNGQTLSIQAGRDEIEAVLAAKDELEAALAEADETAA